MLLALLAIPMMLSALNQRTSAQVRGLHSKKLKLEKIRHINLARTGESVKIMGRVEKISFRWMNRSILRVRDDTGVIPVIMFTPLPEEVRVGDRVEVIGMIMRKFFLRGEPAISGISIGTILG